MRGVEQPRELAAHRDIAFARGSLQFRPIKNAHVASVVLNHARVAKRCSNDADTRAMHAEHGRQKLLGEMEIVALHAIVRDKQPAGEPCFDVMQPVAGS